MSWKDHWKEEAKLDAGGQGQTFRVTHKSTGQQGLLKVLRKPKNAQSRRRFVREMTALKTLDNASIPKVIESNENQSKDPNAELYVIMEYIEGPSLVEYVKKPIVVLDQAISICRKISGILQYIHMEDVVHRDIKASNIILRNSDPQDPVLVDFGICFRPDEKEQQSEITHHRENLGNRTLILPELRAGSSLRRDPRSDLSQCVNLLFSLIAGQYADVLQDHEGKLPHQREPGKPRLDLLDETIRTRLNKIFDRGFQTHIDYRFQSAAALISALEGLTDKEVKPEMDFEAARQKLEDTPEFQKRMADKEILDMAHEKLVDRRLELAQRHHFLSPLPTYARHIERGLQLQTFTLRHELFGDKCFQCQIQIELTGSEVCVTGAIGDPDIQPVDSTEIVRTPAANPDWDFVSAKFTEYIEGQMARALDQK